MPENDTNLDSILRHNDVRIQDVRIISLTGLNISIMEHFHYFELHEDIFSQNISGRLSILDASNLPKNLALSGQEMLFITFGSPGTDTITQGFVIDKISERIILKDGSSTLYDIFFVFPTFINSILNTVNKSYSGKISETVRDIWNNNINPDNSEDAIKLFTEPTVGDHNVVIPGWHPIPTINWLCKRAVGVSNKTKADYIFYQDLDGFKFVSLSSLFSRDVVQVYENFPGRAGMSRDEETDSPDLGKAQRNIEKMVIKGFDNSREIMKGTFASKMMIHDITTKSFESFGYSYAENFDAENSLNGHSLQPMLASFYSPHLNSKQYLIPRQSGLFGGVSTLQLDSGGTMEVIDNPNNDRSEWWVQTHDANINQFKYSSVEIVVQGDTNRRIGDKVILIFGDTTNVGTEDAAAVPVDKEVSGNYIISKIKHTITPESGHSMSLRLCKDSYAEPLPNIWLNDEIDPGLGHPAWSTGENFA